MVRVSILLLFVVMICAPRPGKAAPPLGGMQLLPGYEHEPLQGIDSIVGRIQKKDGLTISYEIGHVPKPGQPLFGGSFSDRPKMLPEASRQWYREQTIGGEPVHLAYSKENLLLVSYPKRGMNLSVKVNNAGEMAEALLMILSYPGEAK